MIAEDPNLTLRLAQDDRDRRAAERLRYRVFVEELGGDGDLVDHDAGLERDRFDPFFDHLILVDRRLETSGEDYVIGVYRLMRLDQAARAGQFYSEDEYDLAALRATGRPILELGRSCVAPAYRGGMAMYQLWWALADYVDRHGIGILFGVASFHGTDIEALAEPLAHLHHNHLAPHELRARVRDEHFQTMDLMPKDQIDRARAMRAIPPLIKSYLKLGGYVGEGAFVDRPFNTTDVFLVMDTAAMSAAGRKRFHRDVA